MNEDRVIRGVVGEDFTLQLAPSLDASCRDRYKGEWKDGMMHGEGTFMWSKGDMYEGDWRAGKMHGRGVKKMGNGDVYDGTSMSGR